MKLLKEARRPVAIMVVFCALLFAGVSCMCLMPGKPSTVLDRSLESDEAKLAKVLRDHVEFLASHPRNRVENPAHEAAVVEYIENELRGMGFQPVRQPIETNEGTFYNIIVRIKGTQKPSELVVIGAHWDTRGATPGADDNATGVAALLELSRWIATKKPGRSLELVFWANEEPPYFQTEEMGSLVHARQLFEDDANVVWMLSLEMLGYYDPTPGAQKYPALLSWFYPEHGAFAAFVGSMWHRSAVTDAVEVMRESGDFPIYGFAGPEMMPGIGFSDQWSFWQVGYPGVMVTDTSFFRTPHYHQYTDTPDTLDWERYPRLVRALRPLIADYGQFER